MFLSVRIKLQSREKPLNLGDIFEKMLLRLPIALCCLIFMPALPGKAVHARIAADVITVEAEHALHCRGWRMVKGYSGQALQDDSERGQGWLRYELEFNRTGRYFVYLLCLAPQKNTSQNDCYLYLEKEKLYAIGDPVLRPDGIRVHTGEFSWSGLPKGPGAHTPDAIRNNRVYFEVPEPGTYTLQVVSRSRGFTLDKILLQSGDLPVPQGKGPVESGLAYEPPMRVGLWDRFEASLESPNSHRDPFREVTLGATFFSPTGRMITTKGFHDGNQAWKVRFMPDETGTWEYEITGSDRLLSQSGQFECLASDNPGMISVYQKNPIWFGYRGGKPLLIRSLHAGDRYFASRDNEVTGEHWNDSLRREFLDWFRTQGYNMLSLASHYLNREQESRGLGWDTPDLWDAQAGQPDPSEYGRLERMLDELHQHRILVYPFAGFFGKGSDFPAEKTARDLYIEYTLARLGSYSNLLFNVGGPEPLLRNRPYLTEAQIDSIARKIKAEDVYGHLLSVHNYTGEDLFLEYPWHDYGILQGPKTIDREELSRIILRNHHPGRPLYLQETLWPGNQYHPPYTLKDVRRNALVMLLSAGTINFGDMNGNSSSGFSGTLDLSLKVQEPHDAIHEVWDFFETVPFYEMKPRQDLVSAGYCLADEGNRYLVYLDSLQTVEIEFIPGIYTGKWISVDDFSREIPLKEISPTASFAPPGQGDWLLYVWRE
jgi:hypothetical protein